MRSTERISVVFDIIFDNTTILKEWLVGSNAPKGGVYESENRLDMDECVRVVQTNSWKIYKEWKASPDLRLGQLLFNMGLTSDGQYHTEETAWLVKRGYARSQDVHFWGTFGLKEEKVQETKKKIKLEKEKLLEIWNIRDDMYKFIDQLDFYRSLTPEKTYKPISQLDTDHLEAIVSKGHTEPRGKYYNLIIEELEYRKNGKI